MTDDVRYSDWIVSVQRIPHFRRVNNTNLIETVSFRQCCCWPSSRHRSCQLWTFGTTFCHPDNSSAASTISQCATDFFKNWVPQIDVDSQQLSLLCGRLSFLTHFGFRRLVCAIKFFGKVCFSVRSGCECFSRCHELLPHRPCRAISALTAWRGWRLLLVSPSATNRKSSSLCIGTSLAIALRDVCCHWE